MAWDVDNFRPTSPSHLVATAVTSFARFAVQRQRKRITRPENCHHRTVFRAFQRTVVPETGVKTTAVQSFSHFSVQRCRKRIREAYKQDHCAEF